MSDKNIYVTLKLTAVKDGAVWQESVLKYPNQSSESYTELEDRLAKMLVQMGLDVQEAKNSR